jgi:trk system potassium uptake protein TrkH
MKLQLPRITEQRLIALTEGIIGGTAIVALVVFVFDYGYYLTPENKAKVEVGYALIGGTFLIGLLAQLIIRRDRWDYLWQNKFKYLLTLLLLIEMIALQIDRWYGQGDLETIHHVLFKLYIVLNVGRKFLRFSQYITQYNTSPARFIIGSFGSLILIGTGLLLLPKATREPFYLIDALFTATSAVCVTGLIVVDTAKAFTTTGQLIILGLIQLGGLGIMTVTTFFTLIVGQRMSGREQVLMGNVLSTEQPAQLGPIIRAVFFTTIGIESCGFLLLYLSWRDVLDPGLAWYTALFHAISAFCNAGFSTFSDSLIRFEASVRINVIVCSLIILGGLGFGTLRNLITSFFSPGSIRQKIARLSVQSKIALVMSGFLLVLGTLLFLLLETSSSLNSFSWGNRLLASFFQSVTSRTAGFNTVDFSQLRASTLMLAMILMFIGVAPGSTGGGIKVTTLAILLGTVISLARGKLRLELFRRTIPVKVLYQTLVVITVHLSILVLISFLLSITENHERPINLMFETVSALGTVGLSTGVTPHLSVMGKFLIILTMFSGRIGPFTLALAVRRRQLIESYQYPEEEVQIG